ncbi:MAG: hypothetical protein K6T83_24015, partial [Alicyclobacillus sp.]|nr:hypothetical protein [Alicyclobacillus sp.]
YTMLPRQFEWNAELGSESLFNCLALVSLCLYLLGHVHERCRVVFTLAAGLALGFACDVRPIPLLFPVLLMAYERCVRSTTWRASIGWPLLATVAMLAAIAPVTIRNFIALHHFVLISTNGGVNLWQGTMVNGSYFWSWNPKINPLLAAGTNQILENQIGMHVALQTMLHHPLRTILNGFIKIFFLYWVDWNVVSVTIAALPSVHLGFVRFFMWGDTIVYWLWMVCAIAGLCYWRRLSPDSRSALALPLTFIVYNTAVFFFFPAWDRFRYPMMPCFALFAAWGWVQSRKRRLPR